jgi:hypothetical protein
MKRAIVIVKAGSAMLAAFALTVARNTLANRREISPEEERLLQDHAQAWEADPCPQCERSVQFAVAQSDRIRSILGDRNDDARTVADLVDELVDRLDHAEEALKP